MTAAIIPMRAPDGRFSNRPDGDAPVSLDRAREIYEMYLAAVCLHQSLRVNEVKRLLKLPASATRRPEGPPTAALPGNLRVAKRDNRRLVVDRHWLAASYARQLALYLANTEHNIKQVQLAAVSGAAVSTVCRALQAIEDVREQADFDRAVDAIAEEMRRG